MSDQLVSAGTVGLEREYAAALSAYLRAGDEAALARARDLGRRAMIDRLGVLDIVELHRVATAQLSEAAASEEAAARAADFFRELLSPFETALRSYRDANDELRHLSARLERQKDAALVANRELESFSYSVSHDLRAPLRSIDGFSRILLEDYAAQLDDEGKKVLRRVRDAASRMAELIDDLLGLARVTRTEMHRTTVDLSAIARAITERLAASAPERSCTFTIQDGVCSTADAHLLEVLLDNLLGNAWKFTSKRGNAEIAFGCEEREEGRAYFVRDNGAGFDMNYAGKLFGAFQRLHSAGEFEGTGVGLATVQRVVHRHGGRVWGEAKVGEGATFRFTLGGDGETR